MICLLRWEAAWSNAAVGRGRRSVGSLHERARSEKPSPKLQHHPVTSHDSSFKKRSLSIAAKTGQAMSAFCRFSSKQQKKQKQQQQQQNKTEATTTTTTTALKVLVKHFFKIFFGVRSGSMLCVAASPAEVQPVRPVLGARGGGR